MLKIARSRPELTVLADELDANPWLFNCQNGTIDLRTGVLQPHARADNLTKAMADANTKGKNKLVRRPPSEKMVQAMIDHAKTLSKAVTH